MDSLKIFIMSYSCNSYLPFSIYLFIILASSIPINTPNAFSSLFVTGPFSPSSSFSSSSSSSSSSSTQSKSSSTSDTSSSTSLTSSSPSTTISSVTSDINSSHSVLSSGAIAGIVVVSILLVFGGLILFFLRFKKRIRPKINLSDKPNSTYTDVGSTKNLNTLPSSNTTTLSKTLQEGNANSLDPVFTVISTYTPTLGDELDIQPGDKVQILVEYDDGWCQGINLSRGKVKGVFPKHCVDMEVSANKKRTSSF